MIISKRVENKLPVKDYSHLYVVADFDRTITNGSSKTSWSILSTSDLVPKEYKDERNALYEKYRPIELDESMDSVERNELVKEWFIKHIELFVKYKITEEIFEDAASNLRIMEFRKGAKDFIDFLHDNKIPLIIISAGIGNFIECFLKHNNCCYDNIYISSNKIIFKNGIASGVDKNIIHSLNKNEVSLPKEIKKMLNKRNNVILLGDQVSDLKMIDRNKHNEIITIGFLTKENTSIEIFNKSFDLVSTHGDYLEVLNVIFNYQKNNDEIHN